MQIVLEGLEAKILETSEKIMREYTARLCQKVNEPVSRYVQQKELLKELGITYPTLRKLEVCGLKRIQFSENSQVVFYDRQNLDQVMAKYAM